MIAAVNILIQSLLLFRCHLLKIEGPVKEELSSCCKAAHTGQHRKKNDKNNPKSTEGRHIESSVPRCQFSFTACQRGIRKSHQQKVSVYQKHKQAPRRGIEKFYQTLSCRFCHAGGLLLFQRVKQAYTNASYRIVSVDERLLIPVENGTVPAWNSFLFNEQNNDLLYEACQHRQSSVGQMGFISASASQ